MKLGLYADPHFSQSSSIIVGSKGDLTGRLGNLIESFTWMNSLFKEMEVDQVVCLGDLTDKPNLTSAEITAMSKCGIEDHYLLVGNHCRSDKDGKINSLEIYPHVINEPTVIGDILFLPYNHDIVDLTQYNHPRVILSHNDIKGYDLGGHTCTEGYDIETICDNCDLFINGHLHNGGWVIRDRILNLGALSGMNFSSCGGEWEPSVAILDTETLKIEFFENPVAYRFKKVDLTSLPKTKGFIDNLPDKGHYVIQARVNSSSLSSKVRQLFSQSDKIVASRILVTQDASARKKTQKIVEEKIEGTTDVYTKLRNFVSNQQPKYSLDKINQIINTISQKEEGAE